MIRRLFVLWILIALLCARGARAQDAVPVRDYVRLHVVAASDGEADQALKLEARDAVLEAVSSEFLYHEQEPFLYQ